MVVITGGTSGPRFRRSMPLDHPASRALDAAVAPRSRFVGLCVLITVEVGDVELAMQLGRRVDVGAINRATPAPGGHVLQRRFQQAVGEPPTSMRVTVPPMVTSHPVSSSPLRRLNSWFAPSYAYVGFQFLIPRSSRCVSVNEFNATSK
jgi:hypothetical protein